MSIQGLPSPPSSITLPSIAVEGSQTLNNAVYPPSSFIPFTKEVWRDAGLCLKPGDNTSICLSGAGRYELSLVISCSLTCNDVYVELFTYKGGINIANQNLYRSTPMTLGGIFWQISMTDYFDFGADSEIRIRCYQESGATRTLSFNITLVKVG